METIVEVCGVLVIVMSTAFMGFLFLFLAGLVVNEFRNDRQ